MADTRKKNKYDSIQMLINGSVYYTVNHPFKRGESMMLPLDVAGGIVNLQKENSKLKNELAEYKCKEAKEQRDRFQAALRGREFRRYGADESDNEVDPQTLFEEFVDNFYDRVDLTDDNGKEVKVSNEKLHEMFEQQYGIKL